MVQPQTNSVEGQTHSRLPKYVSRQTVKTQAGDTNQVIPAAADVQPPVFLNSTHLRWTCLPPGLATKYPS